MSTYDNYKHSELTKEIINAAYEVYNYFGYGFLESVYEKALEIELKKRGFKNVVRQQSIKVYYKGEISGEFNSDLTVSNSVIVELKAVEDLIPKHEVQLVNYLKSTKIEVGLLINFGEELKIKRRVFSNNQKRENYRIP